MTARTITLDEAYSRFNGGLLFRQTQQGVPATFMPMTDADGVWQPVQPPGAAKPIAYRLEAR